MALLAVGASAQDYYDLTANYLKNSLFDENYNYTVSQTGNVAQELLEVDGWTSAHDANYTIVGVYQIGTKKTYNAAAIPALNAAGTAEGGVLALSTGWEKSMKLLQAVTLPAGKYQLISAYYNGDISKTEGKSLLGWVPTSGTSTLSKVASFPVKEWVLDTLTFTVTGTKKGSIQIGFKATAGASSNSAKIAVDYVKLLRDTPFGKSDLDAYKTDLKTLLATAKTLYGTGTKRGAEALKKVMDEAQAVFDSETATFSEIDDVYARLSETINTFKALQTADSALKTLLTEANKVDVTGVGGDALQQAIATAQAVYDNPDATVDELTEAKNNLQETLNNYRYANPTGPVPTVVTDMRYVRGSTMAFGRIKSAVTNGATITKRGFCCSENPEPTVKDILSTKTITSNGTIYWLQDLKPATRYYMRAYAITSGYQVAYGEVIKFYTVPKGNVTYSYSNGGDAATNTRIKNALDQACNYFNSMCYTTRKFNVDYSPGTPTADCNYQPEPHMNIGSNTSYQRCGTIMHEMEHGLGLQNYSTQWSKNNLRSGNGTGQWLGDRVTEALHFWDNNTTTVLNGDGIHMWPYGVNGAQEDNGSDMLYLANAMICQALGEDGLEHNERRHADPYYSLDQDDNTKYYLTNESDTRGLYAAYLVPTSTGVLRWQEMTDQEAAQNDSAAWYFTFTPSNQYYQIRNAATGQYITYSSGIKTAAKTALTANENWHLMPGRVDVDGFRGYWMIHPQDGSWTPPCLQANVNGATAATSFNIANSATAQRWLILSANDLQQAKAAAFAKAKKAAEDVLARVKTLPDVPHKEETAGTDQALQTAIESLEARLTAGTTKDEMLVISSEAEQAGMDFLQNVSATDPTKPFDLTYLLQNPTVEEDATGWNGSPSVSYKCAEFYQKTFDFNQTVKQLPAGTYQFCAQAFQRPGTTADSYAAYIAGTNNVNALLYAGAKNQKIHHICDTLLATKLVGTWSTVGTNKYVPNNMQAAGAAFAKWIYENRVGFTVDNGGSSLRMGLRSTSMPDSYWVIFSQFRLYFYGKMSEDQLVGIQDVKATPQPTYRGIYTLDGRRLADDAQLSRGIYVVDGKKTVIR